jgi:hypothetical protein
VAEHLVADGHLDAVAEARTGCPRTRPSVGFMQIARTRLLPSCWATSASTVTVPDSSSTSNSTALFSSGSAPRGNSTSITGPAMATTRPSFVAVGVSSVMVMRVMSPGVGAQRWNRRGGRGRNVADVVRRRLVAGVEGFGAADDLHDLGRDRVLTGPVHDPAERLDQLFGVVGGGLHRPLAERVLGRCGVQQRGVDTGLDVAREQRVEDRLGSGSKS